MDTFLEIEKFLVANQAFAFFFFFAIGSSLASFFNVVAWRWPQMQETQWLTEIQDWFQEKGWPFPDEAKRSIKPNLTLSTPRSHCPKCASHIAFQWNIPVLGWLLLRGQASCCKAKIPFKYPLFELIGGILSTSCWFISDQHLLATILLLAVGMPLLCTSMVDFESLLLPDSISYGVLWTGLLASSIGIAKNTTTTAIVGAASAYAILATVRIVGSKVLKKEAMGQGDPKLFAACAAWTGPLLIPSMLLIAASFTICLAMLTRLANKENNMIPFGPGLALAGFLAYAMQLQFLKWFF